MRKFAKYKLALVSLISSLALIVGGWLWAYFALRNISQPLVLHFSNKTGINRIGDLWNIAFLGAFGIIVSFVNYFIAVQLEERDWFLGKLIIAVTLFLGILIFIAFVAIINVN